MTYLINKTDGSLLVELLDGSIDQTVTDLTLVGKNVSGYGEFINENFVRLLENFASATPPNNPIMGQLWFDSVENRIKVYNGDGFVNASGPNVSSLPPSSPKKGDFWFNSVDRQLYFYDGAPPYILIGPIYKQQQQRSGFNIVDIQGTDGKSYTVTELWSAGSLLGVLSSHEEFAPTTDLYRLGTIRPGFNSVGSANFKWYATASSADTLVDSMGNLKTVSDFLTTNSDVVTTGSFSVINERPLVLGPNDNASLVISSNSVELRSDVSNQDFLIMTRRGAEYDRALKISSGTQRVGIFNESPNATLHVGTSTNPGSAIIQGTLAVNNVKIDNNSISTTTGPLTLHGDIIVSNEPTPTTTGASFRLPSYTDAQRDSRVMTPAQYGELIYNSSTYKVQAYVQDGAGPGVDGWVNLH